MNVMDVMASNVKKTRINFDQRKTEAIKIMDKNMSGNYKHSMIADAINHKSLEEQIELYEEKLIKA